MTKVLLFFSYFLFISIGTAQNFNPKIIKLPEVPTSQDFSFLKKELENAQIVLLGEDSHQDGNVFEMKTKIVEFLYKEMGFKTVAFESGIYDLWIAQKMIRDGYDVNKTFSNALFSIWGKRKEFQSFIDFYDKNKSDLKLFGFDYQITGTDGTHTLTRDLFDYSKKNKFKFKFAQDDFELLLESISISGMFDEEDISFSQFTNTLNDLQNKISQQQDSEEKFYWHQTVKGLIELGKDAFHRKEILSSFSTTAVDNIRDKQMADNLLAYLKQNPEEKIICWGANAHFTNNMSSINHTVIKDFISMGSYLKKNLKEKVYSLAAVTAKDSIFIQDKWHETTIQQNSFEHYLKQQNVPHLFISSDQEEMKRVIANRFFSPITFTEGKLNELYDGYLFFQKTSPATIVEELNIPVITNVSTSIIKEAESLENSEDATVLDELIIYSVRTPYNIIAQVIESLEKNYPSSAFSSNLHSKVNAKVSDTICLDFEFTAKQYDHGYTKHEYRSVKNLEEIKWNVLKDFKTETLREYHGLVYNSPIQYADFLKKRKFKKFQLTLEEIKKYNNEDVYVIHFTAPRKHSTYTQRTYLSNYSGYLYVSTKDLAIVKIFENWEVTEFPEAFTEGYKLQGSLADFITKKYTAESTTTDFTKIGNLYLITHSLNTVTGKLHDIHNNKKDFTITVNSYWSNFNMGDGEKINFKKEVHLFENVKYNPTFWENLSKAVK